MNYSRREFMRVAGALAGLAAAPLPGCGSSEKAPAQTGEPQLPHLGGAPDTSAGRTIAAFCDTVVPGKYRDPKGAPGAIDVNAPAMFFDPELPALQYVDLLTVALDGYARGEGATSFYDLAPSARDRALAAALGELAILTFAVQLAKLAFYSSREAGVYLGYPGANQGYVHDADFSFRRAMSREITEDGNLP
jgi:hypothetical protein